MGTKRFYTMPGVGRSKYSVNFHDGTSKHKDGSDFFDIRLFKNKKKLNIFIQELLKDGYVENYWN